MVTAFSNSLTTTDLNKVEESILTEITFYFFTMIPFYAVIYWYLQQNIHETIAKALLLRLGKFWYLNFKIINDLANVEISAIPSFLIFLSDTSKTGNSKYGYHK